MTVILIKVFLALEGISLPLPGSSPGLPTFHLSCHCFSHQAFWLLHHLHSATLSHVPYYIYNQPLLQPLSDLLISNFNIDTTTALYTCTFTTQLNSTQLFPNTFFHKLSTWHLQVVAIKLNSSHLLDRSSDQQCIVRAKSYPSTSTTATESRKDMNLYSNDPSEAKRGDVQAAGKKVNDYLMLVCV